MPTSLQSLADSEIDVRYKEPFLTASLNTKVGGGVVPVGCYRGFNLKTNVAALTITVEAAASGDHTAVVESAAGAALTVRRLTGDFSLSLAAFAGSTVVLAVYANYTFGSTTVGDIRAYTVAEYDALLSYADLCFLGTVVVPGAGVIPAANISENRRTRSTDSVERRIGTPLLHNSQFARGDVASAYARNAFPWQWGSAAPASSWIQPVLSGSALEDSDKALSVQTVPTTIAILLLTQYCTTPVNQDYTGGVEIKFTAEVFEALTGGLAGLYVNWRQRDGAPGSAPVTDLTPLLSVVGTDTLRVFVPAPTATDYSIHSIQILLFGATFTGSGTVFQILDFQATAYSRDAIDPNLEEWLRATETYEVAIWDPSAVSREATPNAALAAILRFQHGADPLLTLDRLDAKSAATHPYPSLRVQGSLLGLGTSRASDDPRITAHVDAVDSITLMWESGMWRVYMGANRHEVVFNAAWDEGGLLWTPDDALQQSYRLRIAPNVVQPQYRAPGAPFAESAWEDNLTIGVGEDLASPFLAVTAGAIALTGDRQLVASFSSGFTLTTRVYLRLGTLNVRLEVVNQASWDQNTLLWTPDSAFGPAHKYEFASDGFRQYYHPAGGVPFADAAWLTMQTQLPTSFGGGGAEYMPLNVRNGHLRFTDPGNYTNQTGLTPVAHTLYSANIPKAWMNVRINGGVATYAATFNFDTGATVLSGSNLRFTMQIPMASTSYCVIVTSSGDGIYPHNYVLTLHSSTMFQVTGLDSTGTLVDWDTTDTTLQILVMGRQ